MEHNSQSSVGEKTGLFGWLFTPTPVYAAVYMRMMLGFWTFLLIIPRIPYLKELYTRAPIMEKSGLFEVLHIPDLPVWCVGVMVVVLLFATMAFISGYRVRTMHVLIVLILFYLFGFDRFAIRGFGELGYMQWIWLFFTPYDRLWDENGRVVKAPLWGTALLWLQLVVVYLATFSAKAMAPNHGWWTGEAFYYASHNPNYSMVFVTQWIDFPLPIAKVIGQTTLLLEIIVPLMILFRRTRPWVIPAVLFIHFGAAMTMRVTIFFQLMMGGHAALFLTTRGWEKVFFWLGLADENGVRRRLFAKSAEPGG
jgi:hypothetical protein